MKWPYAVGTKVKMTEHGHNIYGVAENNPKNMVGTVSESFNRYFVNVIWKNGRCNSYRIGTISPVQINLENK